MLFSLLKDGWNAPKLVFVGPKRYLEVFRFIYTKVISRKTIDNKQSIIKVNPNLMVIGWHRIPVFQFSYKEIWTSEISSRNKKTQESSSKNLEKRWYWGKIEHALTYLTESLIGFIKYFKQLCLYQEWWRNTIISSTRQLTFSEIKLKQSKNVMRKYPKDLTLFGK